MEMNASSFYLTRSKNRGQLLAIFFLNMEHSFYLRELQRRLHCSPGVLARELKAFAADGLLNRYSRGKEVFYQINPKHPLFTEIKGIIDKTAGVSVQLRKGIEKIVEIEEAYLYGSFAKGELKADSDIDLLLIGKETEPVHKLIKELEHIFGRAISVTTYTRLEFEKKRKNKSEFLYEVMKSPLIQIKPQG